MACTRHEENKDAFMAVDIGALFRKALTAGEPSLESVKAISRAVVKLTTADDERPTVSRSACCYTVILLSFWLSGNLMDATEAIAKTATSAQAHHTGDIET